jgi:hypothetical protein
MMRRAARFMLALVFCAVCAPAWAWGDKGHRITGMIARDLLTAPARAELKRLMGDDDLASIALYLDKNRASLEERIPGSRKWHFDDVPVCGAERGVPACADGNCASVKLREYQAVLADRAQPDERRQFALWVLTHLIGDLHQPLHAGDHEDRGGNDVKVSIAGVTNARLNLHSAWDAEFIERLYRGQDERDVAAQLVQRYRVSFTAWQAGDFNAWIAESNRIARRVTYGQLAGFSCSAQFGATQVALDAAYVIAAEQVIPEQLARAGARMAFILNRALAP